VIAKVVKLSMLLLLAGCGVVLLPV
jgi:hypothetical protein